MHIIGMDAIPFLDAIILSEEWYFYSPLKAIHIG